MIGWNRGNRKVWAKNRCIWSERKWTKFAEGESGDLENNIEDERKMFDMIYLKLTKILRQRLKTFHTNSISLLLQDRILYSKIIFLLKIILHNPRDYLQ